METKIIGRKNGKVIDLTSLSEGLVEMSMELAVADEILERKIVGIGNGAHINIPLKHKDKMAKIIIKKIKEEGGDS